MKGPCVTGGSARFRELGWSERDRGEFDEQRRVPERAQRGALQRPVHRADSRPTVHFNLEESMAEDPRGSADPSPSKRNARGDQRAVFTTGWTRVREKGEAAGMEGRGELWRGSRAELVDHDDVGFVTRDRGDDSLEAAPATLANVPG